jgi:hypothetical protein
VGSCKSFSGSALAFLRISWRLRVGRSRVWVGLKRRCTPKKEPVVIGTWSWTIWKTIRCRGTYFQTNLQMHGCILIKLTQTLVYCKDYTGCFITKPNTNLQMSRSDMFIHTQTDWENIANNMRDLLLETWWSIVFQCSHYQYVSMKSLHFISGISRPWTGLHPLSHSMQVPSHGRDLLLWKEGQGLPVEKSLVEKCLSTNTNSTSVIYGKKWLWLWFENGLCHQKLMGLTIKNDGFSLVIKTKIRTYRPKSG